MSVSAVSVAKARKKPLISDPAQATKSQDPGVQLGLLLPQEGASRRPKRSLTIRINGSGATCPSQLGGGGQWPIAEVAELQSHKLELA